MTDLTLSAEYQEHVLNNPAICSNCFALVRREREGYTSRKNRKNRIATSYHARDLEHTTVAYAPTTSPCSSKRVFCECGVHGSFTRLWEFPETERRIEAGFRLLDDADDGPLRTRTFDTGAFRERVKHCLLALEAQGLTLARRPFVRQAFAARKDGDHPDEALSRALTAGLRVGAVRSQARPARAD